MIFSVFACIAHYWEEHSGNSRPQDVVAAMCDITAIIIVIIIIIIIIIIGPLSSKINQGQGRRNLWGKGAIAPLAFSSRGARGAKVPFSKNITLT